MNKKIVHLGLIGKDVSKSDSERIHRFLLNEFGVECVYERFSVSSEDFDMVMRRLMGDFDGFNVTIPYKREVLEYLDEVAEDAMSIGAVNTVLTNTRKGYNTDGIGFLQMLTSNQIDVQDKKILILGGGGSGRSSAVALRDYGGKVFMYQRRREKLLETCERLNITPVSDPEMGGFDILINTTGVGMHYTEGQSPVTMYAFKGAEVAIDLIYTPQESEFLRLAKLQGLRTLNGAAMLFYQAYYADCLYLDIPPSKNQAEELYQKFLLEKHNN